MEVMEIKEKLNSIYSKVPDFQCKEGCWDCCGPIHWSPAEDVVIDDWLKQHGRKQRFINSVADFLRCPYLDADDKCTIYEVRPIVCRLSGVVPEMPCEYGSPKRMLSSKEGSEIFRAIIKVADNSLTCDRGE